MSGSGSAVVARIVSLASICAALLISAAQVQCVTYDDDEQLHFYWSPASGNVHHYKVFLYIDGIKYPEEWTTTTVPTEEDPYLVPIDAEPGKAYQLQVQAVAADGITTGPMSELSDPVKVLERQELYLHKGWNLISIYLDIIDTDLSSVLASIKGEGDCSSVWAYDYDAHTSSRIWKRYIPGSPLNGLYTVEAGEGYWINMTGDATLTIIGEPITKAYIPLYSGWNLVGYSSSIEQLPEDSLSSIPGHASIWTYDSVTGDWLRYIVGTFDLLNTLSQLVPGSGYWIYVEQDCEWHITSNAD